QRLSMMNSSDPPLYEMYKPLIEGGSAKSQRPMIDKSSIMEECELPIIDLRKLSLGGVEREECMEDIAKASREWGFFQIVNHGIPEEILEKMRREEVKVFRRPFVEKSGEKFLNLPPGTYRWGTVPSATCIQQISWSEALHIPLQDIGSLNDITLRSPNLGRLSPMYVALKAQQYIYSWYFYLSSTIEQYTEVVFEVAQKLAAILAEKLGQNSTFFKETCVSSSCYLRLNRYPPCPLSLKLYGLVPHTDTDFLTVVSPDDIGGLQVVKDGKWIAVKPNPQALMINIGDFFQAWSNGIYKSVEHHVVANEHVERFSAVFFLSSLKDVVIPICGEPSKYKPFSFNEYQEQVLRDIKTLGDKVGLARFLVGET
ncbi:Isopenicillin N synthase-like, Fe(2+) 2OG dioxygenase domain, partial [Dillenia turbinata]